MDEPSSICDVLVQQMEHFEPGTREYDIRRDLLVADRVVWEQRREVIEHPGLAKQLTQWPLSYTRASAWNGFVPPETWDGEHNDAPRRTALQSLLAAAHRYGAHDGACPCQPRSEETP